MSARYEIKKSSNGQFYFNLVAGNNEVILTSEMYEQKSSANKGIESVKANSPLDKRYDRRTSKSNEPYFVLKAANGEIIGNSEMYSSEASRDKGIESVKANGSSAEVQDLT